MIRIIFLMVVVQGFADVPPEAKLEGELFGMKRCGCSCCSYNAFSAIIGPPTLECLAAIRRPRAYA